MPTGTEHVCATRRRLYRFVVFFVDTNNSRVLVRDHGSYITIPRLESPELFFLGRMMSECFSQRIEDVTKTAYDMIMLYCSQNEGWCSHRDTTKTALFECIGPVDPGSSELIKPSSPYKWMDIRKVEEMLGGNEHGLWTLFRAEQGVFSENGLRPWEAPGWFTRTTDEASSILANLGYRVTAPFEQYIVTPATTVLRVATNKGRVYLKASTKREGGAVQCASKFAPFLVPKPIHVNAEKEWLLMEDYGPTLEQRFSYDDCENMLRLYGKLQLASLEHIPELLAAGVPKQSAQRLLERTKNMLEDDRVRELLGAVDGFSPAQADGKADVSECIDAAGVFLKRLYEDPRPPLALNQGDPHDGNIVKKDVQNADGGRYVLIDWETAVIDLPFSSSPDYLIGFVTPSDLRPANVDAYMQLWADYGSSSELDELYKLVSKKESLIVMLKSYEDPRTNCKALFCDDMAADMYSERLQGLLDWMLQFLESQYAETTARCTILPR